MNRKYGYVILVFITLIALAYFILSKETEEKNVKLPLPNEAEYTEKFNKAILETKERRKVELKNKTPEKLAKEKALTQHLTDISKAAIKSINFFGKVIDQNGMPVAGVIIKHVGHNAVYATGSGLMQVTTDENGDFTVNDARGSAFTVDSLSKPGYEFSGRQRFSNTMGQIKTDLVWSDYSKDNPFIFKAWKVIKGVYPKKLSRAKTTYGYEIGKTYSMDFTTSDKRRVKKKGAMDLDLQVLFERDESRWQLKLMVPRGGLIVTEDIFLNLAPQSGYQQTYSFSGTKKDYMIPKKFYIYSRGKFFGRLIVEIRPSMRRKRSGLGIEHVMNLDGDRNLEVKP